MKTTCRYCGIVNKPHVCPHIKRKTNNNREDRRVYKTSKWQRTRESILDKYNHMCLWNLYIEGRVVSADEVHHIVEILEDESLAYDEDNLIPLEYYNHTMVHEMYKRNKNKTQQLLRMMIDSYREGDKTLGKYKDFI